MIFLGIKYSYEAMLFSTPFIICSMLFSLLYIFVVKPGKPRPFSHCLPMQNLARAKAYFL